jgi:hypothetical protein
MAKRITSVSRHSRVVESQSETQIVLNCSRAFQSQVDKKLASEGLSRAAVGRELFEMWLNDQVQLAKPIPEEVLKGLYNKFGGNSIKLIQALEKLAG